MIQRLVGFGHSRVGIFVLDELPRGRADGNLGALSPDRRLSARVWPDHARLPRALCGTAARRADGARTAAVAAPVWRVAHRPLASALGLGLVLQYRGSHGDVYNILWVVVFGFATLNILNLAARKFEPTRRGMSFGELLAVGVVMLSLLMLGWEMLNLFHIFPIKLHR